MKNVKNKRKLVVKLFLERIGYLQRKGLFNLNKKELKEYMSKFRAYNYYDTED